MKKRIDRNTLYKTQWIAYYKNSMLGPRIVYGESADEAKINALAEYRKAKTMVDKWPLDKVVARVEIVMDGTDVTL